VRPRGPVTLPFRRPVITPAPAEQSGWSGDDDESRSGPDAPR